MNSFHSAKLFKRNIIWVLCVVWNAYSLVLALCVFWLFPKLKRPLRGRRFESIQKIKAESKKTLIALPEEENLACFMDFKKRLHKCILMGGDYFEEDFTKQFILIFAHSKKSMQIKYSSSILKPKNFGFCQKVRNHGLLMQF